jgi:hypothetical protein
VAGPGSATSEPAVLTLSAKHNAGSKPGAYTKFNQTITVKRTKPTYEGKDQQFEVRMLSTSLDLACAQHCNCMQPKRS